MSEQNQIVVTGRKITMPTNSVFGENQPNAIYVQGIHHVHGQFEKLEFVVFDAQGTAILSGSEVIEGADYSNWDKNNADYPYQYVCGKRGMQLVTE